MSAPPLIGRLRDLGRRREVVLVALLAVLAGGAWGLVELAGAVGDGTAARFDERVLLAFREGTGSNDPVGSARIEGAVRDVTALGSLSVLTFLALAVTVYFALDRRPRTSLYVVVAVVGGFYNWNKIQKIVNHRDNR